VSRRRTWVVVVGVALLLAGITMFLLNLNDEGPGPGGGASVGATVLGLAVLLIVAALSARGRRGGERDDG
jgi:formiminotetrahydrofolate cyclodeaminase